MRAAAALAALLLATACVGPSRTDADYRAKAANTAEAIASAVESARFGVDALKRGNVPAAYLSRLVAEAEEDALAAQQSFDVVQPPSDHADAIHDALDEIVADALDSLRAVRIAVRRGQASEAISYGDRLADVAQRLHDFEESPRA